MENKEIRKDLYALSKYQEWYALKFELESFIKELDNNSEIDISKPSRISIAEEVAAKQYAKEKIVRFLQRMSLWEKDPVSSRKDPYQ